MSKSAAMGLRANLAAGKGRPARGSGGRGAAEPEAESVCGRAQPAFPPNVPQ